MDRSSNLDIGRGQYLGPKSLVRNCLDIVGVRRQYRTAVTDSVTSFTNDVRILVRDLLDGIYELPPSSWDEMAGTLAWSRWETAEHLADDLLTYGARLAAPGYPHDIPFATSQRRAGAPDELVHAGRDSGPEGLAAVIEAAANLFVAVAEAASPDINPAHVFGRTGAEGFAAMSVVELIVHGHDLFTGTGVDWAPADATCGRVLARLFPDVDVDVENVEFDTLLWATGRLELPGRERRTDWRWYN